MYGPTLTKSRNIDKFHGCQTVSCAWPRRGSKALENPGKGDRGAVFSPQGKDPDITARVTWPDTGRLVLFLASGAGLGYIPLAPGTFGTLVGVLLYLGLGRLPLWVHLPAVVLLTLAAIPLAGRAETLFDQKDDGRIVVDEIAGFLVTTVLVRPAWGSVILGFIFFRFFDILKPWPVRGIDRKCAGGLGVVLDDVVAGVYAGLCLLLAIGLWPGLGQAVWK